MLANRLRKSPFFIRLLAWEYWPAWLTNIPVGFFWLYFAAKARHLFFFSAANPAIETGGVMGESKKGIMDQVPQAYKPQSLFIQENVPVEEILLQMEEAQLDFPIVAKPNVGERGLGVEKLEHAEELRKYRQKIPVDIILQEYVAYTDEYSVLYYRFPNQQEGHITSLCHKIHLQVQGDGKHSLRELIKASPRALLQLPKLETRMGAELDHIPESGKQFVLLPIGNHARGAMFLDANDQIDEELRKTFDQISLQLKGIYICRFDLKCNSLEELKAGKAFKILEINGVLGEPAHIYDPNYPVRHAYRDLFRHWRKVFEIGKEVHRIQGIPYMSWKEAKAAVLNHWTYIKTFRKRQAYGA